MEEKKNNYFIPEHKFDWFKQKFEKLQKRARKLGCEEPKFEVVGSFNKKVKHEGREVILVGTEISVSGSAPVISGYSFVGSIDHLDEGNIVKNLSKEVSLTSYIDSKPSCDHCKINRKRNSTFILLNQETKQLKQVGSTCLVDFLGHSAPENIASIAELFADLFDMCENLESEYYGGGGGVYHFPLNEFLGIVKQVISMYGWVPKSKASDLEQSTSSLAWNAITSKNSKDRIEPTEEELTIAEKAIEWAQNLPDEDCMKNEYLHNIRLIAKREIAEGKFTGYAASILPAYDRQLSKAAEAKTAKLTSNHVGNIGDKLELVVTLYRSQEISSDYGVVILSMFKDDKGNIFKWFGKGFLDEDFPIGETKTIYATVKNHETYKEVKQTSLTRCSLVPPAWAKKRR